MITLEDFERFLDSRDDEEADEYYCTEHTLAKSVLDDLVKFLGLQSYRKKTDGHTVPNPVREPLEEGTEYWYVSFKEKKSCEQVHLCE